MATQWRVSRGTAAARNVNQFRMFPDMLVAYQGQSMLLSGIQGRLSSDKDGLYHHKTRFLSRLTLTVNGAEPAFVSANAVDPHSTIAYFLAPVRPGGCTNEVEEKGIEIQVSRIVSGGLHQDVTLTNHTQASVTIALAWEIDADYHDICAPPQQSEPYVSLPVPRTWAGAGSSGELVFDTGHDALRHGTVVRFVCASGAIGFEDGRVVQRLTLPPHAPVDVCIKVHPVFQGEETPVYHGCHGFGEDETPYDDARRHWLNESSHLAAANMEVQLAWERAVSDLGALPLFLGEGPQVYTPAAGIPIYQALFGRDTLTTAWQSSLLNPLMLRGVIETIAARLGTKYDDRFDEQPGRVIHQQQLSPSALLGHTPYLGYYGDYAGPGLFVMAVGHYYQMTGDRAFVARMRDKLLAVLEWMDRDGDRDGDGFYEYDTRAGGWGTKNQGWKDSPEAFVYEDGSFAPNPLAAAEIQGYYFAAKAMAGALFHALGDEALGRAYEAQAEDLKRRFNQSFWVPELGFYALALGPEKTPLKSVASNAGHCLAVGIVEADKAEAVAARLMAPDMFSGWGIRTLSSDHPAYNPFSYHLGSVWPSENATIAWGLKRYGFDQAVQALAKGLFDASGLFDQNRLPEAIGGHPRDRRHPHPGIYPRSCAPQAWSASAIVMVMQALLGLRWDAPHRTLWVAPSLPEWLPDLTIEGVHVGTERVSLRFRRSVSGETDFELLSKPRRVQVVYQPFNQGEPGADETAA